MYNPFREGALTLLMWKLVAGATAAAVIALILWAPLPSEIGVVQGLAAFWKSEPAPAPIDDKRLQVALARFEGDGWSESNARLVVGTFQEFPELNVIRLEGTMTAETADREARHEKARQYLQRTGAHVVVWGTVAAGDGGAVHLSVTMAPAVAMETRWRRYQHAARLDLPQADLQALRPLLRLLAAQLAAESRARLGDPPTDDLGVLAGETRAYLDAPETASWTAAERGLALVMIADALNLSGTLRQRKAELQAALDTYRAALELLPRQSHALHWGRAQNNLGNVLLTLGVRDKSVELLSGAIEAYKAALETRSRERAPHDWAATQSNLGNALHIIGERKGDAALLEEAVAAYRASLEERTAETTPVEWGMTQASLAGVLQTLGEREPGTARLEEAIAAYYASLSVQSRTAAPLDWAATHNNLGTALQALGGRENNATRLAEAIDAYRAALTERRRDRAPEEWAVTQNNLGNALQALALMTEDASYLREAVKAYRTALEERTRERLPHAWAETQNNLGAALKSLGEREAVPRYLEEAAEAYKAALQVLTRERTPLDWAAAQNNLGNVLASLGQVKGDAALLCEALRHHANAWRAFKLEAPSYAQVAEESLRHDQVLLEAVNTRQTRQCLGAFTEVFKAIAAG